jgi:hypothetical protein
MPLRTTTIEQTTTLTSPSSLVFAIVMSPEAAPLIDPAVREWRADSRPIGVGTRFTIRGRLGWMPIRATSEVVVWEPPTVGEFRSIAPTWPFRMTARHRFGAVSNGGTEYAWSISFHEVNVVARPLIALAVRLFRRAMAAQAEMLTRHLDERSDSEPLPRL